MVLQSRWQRACGGTGSPKSKRNYGVNRNAVFRWGRGGMLPLVPEPTTPCLRINQPPLAGSTPARSFSGRGRVALGG